MEKNNKFTSAPRLKGTGRGEENVWHGVSSAASPPPWQEHFPSVMELARAAFIPLVWVALTLLFRARKIAGSG